MKHYLVLSCLMIFGCGPLRADMAAEIVAQSKALESNKATQDLAKSIVQESKAASGRMDQKNIQEFVKKAQVTQKGRQEALKVIEAASIKQGPGCDQSPQCKGDTSLLKTMPQGPQEDPRFFVFVSFSMNDAALKALSKDIQKIGGRMVLRGLIDNSFVKTQKRLQDLNIECEIDPPLFDTFQIKHIPTFIHAQPLDREKGVAPLHDRLKGNVSVSYVLETFSVLGQIKGADVLLKTLNADA